MLAALLARIAENRIDGPDLAVLKATMASKPELEAAFIADALGMRAAPVVERLLVRLATAARRLRLFGAEQLWIDKKLSQSVCHRLCTLRRESDQRRAGTLDQP